MIDQVNAEVSAQQYEAPSSSGVSDKEPTAGPLEMDECFAGVSSHVGELRTFVRDDAQDKYRARLIGARGVRQKRIVFAIHRRCGQSSHSFYSVVAREHG